MILPPVTQEYDVGSQAVMHEELEKADVQNFKLDQDNFLDTGSICLKDSSGDWYTLGVNTSGVLTVTQLTGTQLDAAGRPVIASTNPYS
tara:strand:+ start:223 stop:489 length:267 start_codon:yes stop_codon:yes gene_type:complete